MRRGVMERIAKLLPQCQVVVFEDYDKELLILRSLKARFALATKHNIPTVVDPKRRNFLAYKNVTLLAEPQRTA